MTKEQITFMKELQHEMLTQDTVGQADPRFWVVRGVIKECGFDSGYADGYSLFVDFETCIDTMEEACDWLQENDDTYIYVFDSKYETISVFDNDECEKAKFDNLKEVCDFITDELIHLSSDGNPRLGYYKNVEKIYQNSMFLTNRECKEHIAMNQHHYPKNAHSYAMTAWRSPQVEKLYKILQTADWDYISQLLEKYESSHTELRRKQNGT